MVGGSQTSVLEVRLGVCSSDLYTSMKVPRQSGLRSYLFNRIEARRDAFSFLWRPGQQLLDFGVKGGLKSVRVFAVL